MSLVVDSVYLGLVALGVYLVLHGIRSILRVMPFGRSRLELVERFWPTLLAFAAFGFLAYALRYALRETPEWSPVIILALFLSLVSLTWSMARDIVSGALLKASRVCQVGNVVRIGDVEGRIERLGLHAITLVTAEGEEAVVPFGEASRSAIVRSPVKGRVSPHVFRVQRPSGLAITEARRRIQTAALLQHWASVVRDPEVQLLGEDCLEVTVFTLDSDYAHRIESAIRERLG